MEGSEREEEGGRDAEDRQVVGEKKEWMWVKKVATLSGRFRRSHRALFMLDVHLDNWQCLAPRFIHY